MPTRYPVDLTRRMIDRMREGSLDTAPHAIVEPASVFTDPEHFARECDVLFRHGLHVVGWAGELPAPNTYTTKDVAGVPVLITRDGEGEAHAFLNASAHRGARMAADCGVARRFTCPYHAWVFPTFADPAIVDLPESEWPEPAPLTLVHVLFLSCVILETPVSSQMLRIDPGRSVGECTVELTEASIMPIASAAEREARAAGVNFAAQLLGGEDFPVAEQCQRGAEAGLANFVFGSIEPMLQHWHTAWREALTPYVLTTVSTRSM